MYLARQFINRHNLVASNLTYYCYGHAYLDFRLIKAIYKTPPQVSVTYEKNACQCAHYILDPSFWGKNPRNTLLLGIDWGGLTKFTFGSFLESESSSNYVQREGDLSKSVFGVPSFPSGKKQPDSKLNQKLRLLKMHIFLGIKDLKIDFRRCIEIINSSVMRKKQRMMRVYEP